MDEELNKLNWFLEGPFFTVVPPPTPNESGQEFGEYLNKNNLTIVSFDVVDNLKKQLNAKEKEWEEEREEMKKEMKKLRLSQAVYMLNQTKLVKCIRKIGKLTEFNESFGSDKSNFVLVGQAALDRFYDHVQSSFEKMAPSHSSSESTVSTLWEDVEKRKVKKARTSVIHSSDEETQGNTSPRQPVLKVIKRTAEHVPSPPSPQPCSSSSSMSESCTKLICNWCMDRVETAEDYKEHRKIVYPALAESRDHGESDPRYLTRAKMLIYKKYFHSPDLFRRKVKSYTKTSDELFSDDDDDSDEGTGSDDEANRAGERPVNCSVCGDPFVDMAQLNGHINRKHGGNGGAM